MLPAEPNRVSGYAPQGHVVLRRSPSDMGFPAALFSGYLRAYTLNAPSRGPRNMVARSGLPHFYQFIPSAQVHTGGHS